MAYIRSFFIKSFKGIKEIDIKISDNRKMPIITLVGLNESGKTTILEALSYFPTGDSALASMFTGPHARASINSIIPIHKKAAFTGNIVVGGKIALEPSDKKALKDIFANGGLQIDMAKIPEELIVYRDYEFVNSEIKDYNNRWPIQIYCRPSSKDDFERYERPADAKDDLWLSFIRHLELDLPRIAYFPTFLVNFPSKIYLKSHKNETRTNIYYRLLMQDILDSLDEDLNLEEHVIQRIEKFKENEENPNWFSLFYSDPSKRNVDSVLRKLSNEITKEVIGSWHRVFNRSTSAKSVNIEWNVDPEKEELPFISFFVSDGESSFALEERSLGFRWFFSFLLFTVFKKKSKRRTLFLFDEPAANLHAKAQMELLKSFERIASSEDGIIYTTHSHYMINPKWISHSFVIDNEAISDDMSKSFQVASKPNNIRAVNYRQFASQYPRRSSYFQPIIESLDFILPEIVGHSPYLILEGISDYYLFKYCNDSIVTNSSNSLSIIPGSGSGSSGPLISFLLGRGEKFGVMLDDDRSGRLARDRYRQNWNLSKEIFTIGDLDQNFQSRKLENLLSPETIRNIQNVAKSSASPNKKQIMSYLAEMNMPGTDASITSISEETRNSIMNILSMAKQRLDEGE